jgi:LysR family transcriptional activator of nhaA
MQRLNYHHLHYFWFVARTGKLTEAASHLRVAQSALSTQIRQLEEALGQQLFLREGRTLKLTEAGRIAFSYAEDIFRRGEELSAVLTKGHGPERPSVRIGAVATLSRNFQDTFLAPLLERKDVHLVMESGRLQDLLERLDRHALDLVLSNTPVVGDEEKQWRCRRLARQQVSVIGHPRRRQKEFRLPRDLDQLPLILPSTGSEIRQSFELLCDQWGIRPVVLAEVDDMAMLRLLVRDWDAVGVLPKVVVRDEIAAGTLQEYATLPGLHETFYAISVKRHFEAPLVRQLLSRAGGRLLEPAE